MKCDEISGGENDDEVCSEVYHLSADGQKWQHKGEMVPGVTETTIHSSYAVINVDIDADWLRRWSCQRDHTLNRIGALIDQIMVLDIGILFLHLTFQKLDYLFLLVKLYTTGAEEYIQCEMIWYRIT